MMWNLNSLAPKQKFKLFIGDDPIRRGLSLSNRDQSMTQLSSRSDQSASIRGLKKWQLCGSLIDEQYVQVFCEHVPSMVSDIIIQRSTMIEGGYTWGFVVHFKTFIHQMFPQIRHRGIVICSC